MNRKNTHDPLFFYPESVNLSTNTTRPSRILILPKILSQIFPKKHSSSQSIFSRLQKLPNGHKYTRTHKRARDITHAHTHTRGTHTGCGWYERDHFFTFYITQTLNRSAYLLSVQHNEHSMSAINFSIPAPTNGLKIDHRNPPTTHIFNDVAIDGTIHKVVYICGDQMVYQPTPLPSQKNDNDIFYLSSDEDGLEGLDLLPPISSPCLLYTSPSPRDATLTRMPSSA